MSRFWSAAQDSDSESGSEKEPEVLNNRQTTNRFQNAYDSDTESEDEVRVVKSQSDRTLEALKEKVGKIRSYRKSNNWSSVHDEFDEVNKMMEKSKAILSKLGTPKFYIKMLGEVEDSINAVIKDKESFKKLKPTVAHAVNRLKLNVRKHNKKYEAEIEDFRAHPDNYASSSEEEEEGEEEDEEEESEASDKEDSSEESGSEEESESDESSSKGKKKPVAAKKTVDESDSDSLSGASASESSSEDEQDLLPGRARWLKKVPAVKPTEAPKLAAPKPAQPIVAAPKVVKVSSEIAKKAWSVEYDLKEEVLDKKLAEIVASRGKKSTEPKEILRKLEVLSKAAKRYGARKEIPVLMHVVSAMFDAQRSIDDFMDLQQWRTCFRCLDRIMELLDLNRAIVLGVMPTEDVNELVLAPVMKMKKNEEEEEEENNRKDDGTGPLKVVGSLESFVARLEDEYMKSLQQINPHTQDYVTRLSDEATLVELAESIQAYYHRVGDERAAAAVALLHVEHTYYKHESISSAVLRAHYFSKAWGRYSDLHPACLGKSLERSKHSDVTVCHPAAFSGSPNVDVPPNNVGAKLESQCQLIFKHGDERSKTRALLCSVYYHSLHDRYHRAKDLFLMSHIPETIDRADIRTQILYNRTLVTMGLAAFRLGLIQRAHDCLSGICSGRMRELLAQGQSRFLDRDVEQEREERRRQMPFHMHINPDLLEGCHMISAMFLELPLLTRSGSSSFQMIASKTFRKYMSQYNRQTFIGPPENVREHILAAAKALLNGDWQQASDYLLKLEVWNLIPADGGLAVKAMLQEKLKEEAVRMYLLTCGGLYDTIEVSFLSSMFSVEASIIRKVVSSMILNKEISAAWENGADVLLLYSVEPSNLQTMALHVAEKVAQLVDTNERLIDPLVNANFKDDTGRYAEVRGNKQSSQSWAEQADRKRTPAGLTYSGRLNFVRPNPKRFNSSQKSTAVKTWGKMNTSNKPMQQQSQVEAPGKSVEHTRKSSWM